MTKVEITKQSDVGVMAGVYGDNGIAELVHRIALRKYDDGGAKKCQTVPKLVSCNMKVGASTPTYWNKEKAAADSMQDDGRGKPSFAEAREVEFSEE